MRYRIRYLCLLLAIPLQLAAVDYTVSVTTNTCSTPQTYTIPEGEQMVLYAHPMAGYTFAQWSDGNTDNPRIVTVTSDASYAAEFVAMSPMPTTYDVTVYADGCATPKVISVIEGEQILLNAHAKSGYAFSQWSDGNTDNPRAAIINADATFKALFEVSTTPNPDGVYTFTVNAENCSTSLSHNFSQGTEVKLYAEPIDCNYFVRWSDGNTDNPRTLMVTEDLQLTAEFEGDGATEPYLRDVPAHTFGTICLPFGSNEFSGATFYEIAYYAAEVSQIYLDEVKGLVAGMPYLFYSNSNQLSILPNSTTSDNALSHNGLYGTFSDISGAGENVLTGKYIVYNNEFRLCGLNCSLPANRAYLELSSVSTNKITPQPGRQRVSMSLQGENTTTTLDNITEDIQSHVSPEGTYDVLGRRLHQPTGTGFYIINGQKVVITK